MGRKAQLKIDDLFRVASFKPNENQRRAILYGDGPLHIIAGPGSGKTRVLLWRALNLIVFGGANPDELYLSTFTEKAAKQLRDGLRYYLGLASNRTGMNYDVSQVYVGTVHSLCRRLLVDRRFAGDTSYRRPPRLLDEVDQYFFVARDFLRRAENELGFGNDHIAQLNDYFGNRTKSGPSQSKHAVALGLIPFFNRLSEEMVAPRVLQRKRRDKELALIGDLYGFYVAELARENLVDFPLLQRAAFDRLSAHAGSAEVFRYVIIDEYQDTNAIQEKIFFRLAGGFKNMCVVGDDDQALYRFRGATVENFVQFPDRCETYFGQRPEAIKLNINYRSRNRIVDFYSTFIEGHDWSAGGKKGRFYRLMDKGVKPHRRDKGPSVVATQRCRSEDACQEIATFVEDLIKKKKVADPNQIAFLYPSLGSVHVTRMKDALEEKGLAVYAPRAGRFFECDEPTELVGLYLKVFGEPENWKWGGADYQEFDEWLGRCTEASDALLRADTRLRRLVVAMRRTLKTVERDYALLMGRLAAGKWKGDTPYDHERHHSTLVATRGLSARAKRALKHPALRKAAQKRLAKGNPFRMSYIVNRAASTDWSVLDLFYRFCGFDYFKKMFDAAEKGQDEGPVCNLALFSQYVGRFVEIAGPVITGRSLRDGRYKWRFFIGFIFPVFRLGVKEFEDAEDPFPKGRIPFLTIHQAKGLEFPVVVLGNPCKRDQGPQFVEEELRPFLSKDLEPLERSSGFDITRMFYVALSRAKNLLVIANLCGSGVSMHPIIKGLLEEIPSLNGIKVKDLPEAKDGREDLGKTYSFTSDYLLFRRCPRQYMYFREYGFTPSRSQTMFFGNLVHWTLDDLHNKLIREGSLKR